MNFGIHPQWGIFLTEARVGEWATFAVNQGFRALEIRIDFRMLESGLHQFFDPKVVSILQNARLRGLEFHVGIEPFDSYLCSWRSRLRQDSLSRVRQILTFLETTLPPQFLFVYPGKSEGRRELGTEYLVESLRELREAFPFMRIGVNLGAEGDCLKTPEETQWMRSHLKSLDLVLDAGWALAGGGEGNEKLKRLLQAAGDNLYSVHWRNLASPASRLGLPLSRGRFLEADYYSLLALIAGSRQVWHTLDYRDRTKKSYLADKNLLEDLAGRARRRAANSH